MAKRKKEPELEPSLPKLKLIRTKPDTSTPDFVEIGGSPVPGLTLRHVLRGHTGRINRMAWSPDGKYLASPSDDQTIRIWDMHKGELVKILEGFTEGVNCVAWSPNGQYLASGAGRKDGTNAEIKIWDSETWLEVFTNKAKTEQVRQCAVTITWSPDGKTLIAGNYPDGEIHLWDTKEWKICDTLTNHLSTVYDLRWAPNKMLLASVSWDGNATIWDPKTWKEKKKIQLGVEQITRVGWFSDNRTVLLGDGNGRIHIWNINKRETTKVIEGHTDSIYGLAISADNRLVFTLSMDHTIRIWNRDTWETIAVINQPVENGLVGFELNPIFSQLATIGDSGFGIHIWEIGSDILYIQKSLKESVHYTTAKLVLVGDSGVGKTGLGWRLAHGEFKEHASTHGQQFWSIPQLGLKRKDGTDCEAVLWDLAGQHVYRQVHSIFLENVAAALVLFDPTNRQEPLKGAQFWLEQLKGKGQLPPTVLVGARVDRGAPALSQAELDQFCQRYGIKGGYISTSALKGDGLDELLDIIKAQIPWDDMTATVTTVTFKRIKDYVLSLKEKTDRKGVLVDPNELQMLLASTDEDWIFSDAEMMTAVGHLETHGYVSILNNSAGEKYILLTPDLLVNLAASIMLLADKNARELGAVSETELLQGKYPFDELKGLEKPEQQILIDAAILRFLDHNICFRDTFNDDTLLIFPSLIKQKRPLQDDTPATDNISYVVRGRVENIYASLVVLLGYTPSFNRINQWQNQAQYEMKEGEICGFRSIEEREGEIELVLYYTDKMPQNGREKFQELFEQFLYQHQVEVTRFPPVVCKNGHQQKRATVVERAREGKTFVFCDECGDKVSLPDFETPQTIGIGASPWLQREEAMARLRSSYEKHLTNIKSFRRGWAVPRAYLSYLPEQKTWAEKLIHDLRDAGVYIIEGPDDIKVNDFAIILDTPAYRRAFQSSASILAADVKVIRSLLGSTNRKLLSLACEGKHSAHNIKQCTPGDFCDDSHYSVSLFNLVMELYAIPLNLKGFESLRHSLHTQWENTLAGKEIVDMASPLKVFISYSHKDEEFKDDLVIMLEGLRRQGIIDPWQDRRIEEGDEWFKEIENTMNECDLAILLVSQHFIASRFIQDKELPHLLQRRQESGLRVVPIIVRPCKWTSEPVLKDIQALPKNGTPVITFSKDNGDRDQVWTDIATAIEKRAKG